MKMFRILVTLGLFFLSSQGMTVFLFRAMLRMAKEQNLPIEGLLSFQILIMRLVIGSLVAFGVLFALVVLIWTMRALRSDSGVLPRKGMLPEDMQSQPSPA